MLSPEVLGLLRQWWKVRPTRYDAGVPQEQRWLFPGRKPGKPMTTRQLSRLFHQTADAAGIKKAVTLHAYAIESTDETLGTSGMLLRRTFLRIAGCERRVQVAWFQSGKCSKDTAMNTAFVNYAATPFHE